MVALARHHVEIDAHLLSVGRPLCSSAQALDAAIGPTRDGQLDAGDDGSHRTGHVDGDPVGIA
jgi:hypothetical protein